jgi:hypothetical protein
MKLVQILTVSILLSLISAIPGISWGGANCESFNTPKDIPNAFHCDLKKLADQGACTLTDELIQLNCKIPGERTNLLGKDSPNDCTCERHIVYNCGTRGKIRATQAGSLSDLSSCR